jgi:hypothetical protein
VILGIKLHKCSIGELLMYSGSMLWTSAIFYATDDCDEFVDVVYGLVSSVRKGCLKLVLEGETIKSRYLSRFAKLIICTQSLSVRQGKDMISIAEDGRDAAFKYFEGGFKKCTYIFGVLVHTCSIAL